MKVPAVIKKAIRDKAKAGAIVQKNDAIIRNWFKDNQMSNDSVFDIYIDSTETGNDPDGLIEFIEKENFSYGNSSDYDEE